MVSGQKLAMDPVDALKRQGTLADAATLRRMCDPWAIRKAVADGRIIRSGPRRYALPGAKDIHLAAAQVNGILCLVSAAQFWGWKVKQEPAATQVRLPRGRKVTTARRVGIDLRRHDVPPNGIHRGIVTTKVQTVIDSARLLPFDEALCIADSALRQGGVAKSELIAAAELVAPRDRRKVMRVVHAADKRADNPFESCLRAICDDVPGLSVAPQVTLDGIGRADLVDVSLRLVLEAESLEFHNDPLSFRNDIRRYTAMVRAQWRVVRFCWEDVMFQQEYVAAVLADLVAGGSPQYAQIVLPALDPRLGSGA